MAMTLPGFMIPEVRKWVQAIRISGPTASGGDNAITDADLAALTTVQGLIDLVNTSYATPRTPNDTRNCRATLEAIYSLGPNGTPTFGYGIIENADVVASNTVAALITAIYTNAGVPAAEQDVDATIVGNTQYLGNIQTGSNI